MKKSSRTSLIAILSVLFLDNFGLAIVYPIFTPLILLPQYGFLPHIDSLAVRTLCLGFLIASFPFAQFLGAPFLGDIADRKGRKIAYYLSLIGETLGFAFSAIAIYFADYTLLLISRLCTGFFAGNLTICLSSISDMSPFAKSRSKNFGLLATVGGISFIIAIFVGGELSDHAVFPFFNSSFPFWITAGFSVINLVIIAKLFDEVREPTKKRTSIQRGIKNLISVLESKKIPLLYGIFFFFMLGWISSLQFLSAYLIETYDARKEMIVLTFLGVGIFWSIGNGYLNRILIKKYNLKKILFYSLLFLVVFFTTAILSPDYYLFYLFMALASLCVSLCWTNLLSLISLSVMPDLQGKVLGLNQSIMIVAMIVSPIVGGFIGQISTQTIYLFSLSAILISFFITLLSVKFFHS